MIQIAAIRQIRVDSEGRTYYRRKRAEGKKPMEAVRCLKRRISDAIYRQLVADQQRADPDQVLTLEAGPGGHCGASQISSAAGSYPHTDTSDQPLPGPAQRRYAHEAQPGRPAETGPSTLREATGRRGSS